MNRRDYIKTVALGAILPMASTYGYPFGLGELSRVKFSSQWHLWPDMKWVGPQYWANRLQDWVIEKGKLRCLVAGKNRTLHLLTLQNPSGSSKLIVKVGITNPWIGMPPSTKGCVGLRIGAKGRFDDYRSAAVYGKGLDVGLTADGKLKIGESLFENAISKLPNSIELILSSEPKEEGKQELTVKVIDQQTQKVWIQQNGIEVDNSVLQGNFALLCDVHTKDQVKSIASFDNWIIESDSIYSNSENLYGPICFAQYTLHRRKLKLTAQLAPIEMIVGHSVSLEIKLQNTWKVVSEKTLTHQGRAVNFQITEWYHEHDIPYRVCLKIPTLEGNHLYYYEGTIAKEPIDEKQLTTAVFSCNADFGFPDSDIYESVLKLDPDVILFLGDQFYEGTGGFGAQYEGDFDVLCLDYLHKWMMFGWSYRELFRHKPCAIIPDDHDVYHGNVWGEGGKLADNSNGFGAKSQDSGGYKMPPEWVNMVQYSQTSHLPDPYDPKPVDNGIRVYYTHWNYAGVSFAILEDRKFKSAPQHVLPKEAEIYNGWIRNKEFDIKKYKDLEAELLGKRQEDFLEDWVHDWSNNTQMKVVLSQTNFATIATLPSDAVDDGVVPGLYIPELGEYIKGDAPTVDMDSNGWPANKRDKALSIIRKGFAFHIAGDQHLGSFIQYGVETHEDSGYAFAGPALNNIWPRRFWPSLRDPNEHSYDSPAYVGQHIDGFGNKATVLAVANPHNMHKEPKVLHNRALGYGVVTFDKEKRTIKTDCYRRFYNPLEKIVSTQDGLLR